MAYGTPTYTTERAHGPAVVVTVSGTALGSADKVLLDKLPEYGRIVRIQSRKTAGTATNGQPRLTSDAAGNDIVTEFTTTLAYAGDACDEQFDPPVTYHAPDGLYYWPQPDAGADNDLADEIHILPGWED